MSSKGTLRQFAAPPNPLMGGPSRWRAAWLRVGAFEDELGLLGISTQARENERRRLVASPFVSAFLPA